MRTRPTRVRGWIGLIEKGSGTIIGAAYLKDSLSTLERSKHRLHYRRHRVPLEPGQKVHKGKYLFPWVMEKAFRLAKPVAYIDDFDLAPAEPKAHRHFEPEMAGAKLDLYLPGYPLPRRGRAIRSFLFDLFRLLISSRFCGIWP
jgi:hypothetical protein